MKVNRLSVTLCLLLSGFASASASASASDNNDVSSYIVNGVNAPVSEYPSIANLFLDSFEYDGKYFTNPFCGGTILDEHHILTAAHCIYGNEAISLFTVVVPQLQNVDDYPLGDIQRNRVKEIYYRNDYNDDISYFLENDVAILKLETAMNIDTINDVIRRPDSESYRNDQVNTKFTAVGHGDTVSGYDGNDQLLQVDLNLVSNSACSSVFLNGDRITTKQICFDGDYSSLTRLKNGTCQGDSGGPVYWYDGSKYVQVGITSFGPSSCGANIGVTSVFTEIHDYNAWIDSVLAGGETPKSTSSDNLRTNYLAVNGEIEYFGNSPTDGDSSSSSSSSGGSISILGLPLILLAALRRRKMN
ncbi:S1 family peptidase [Vibrio gallaecicus]|uniref:Trypsin-like serine protease n=1 Tax=Vibrio gallaecicus TaxID=552386 RepID=A0ABV4NHH8_9VIBR